MALSKVLLNGREREKTSSFPDTSWFLYRMATSVPDIDYSDMPPGNASAAQRGCSYTNL